jgi:hypothetical protein
VTHDALGDAAPDPTLDSRPTVGRHHNEIDPQLGRGIDDRACRIAGADLTSADTGATCTQSPLGLVELVCTVLLVRRVTDDVENRDLARSVEQRFQNDNNRPGETRAVMGNEDG